jgi:hypothetical protein
MKAFARTTIFAAAAMVMAGSAWSATDAGASASKPAHKASLVADMDCSACHTSEGWKLGPGAGSGAGGFDHSKTGFPLTGEHARTTCVGCHVPGRPITRECSGCHADTHEARFGASCDGCHRPTSWNETKVMDDHRRTRLPLTGIHAMIDCSSCHLRTGERAYSETPSDCFACHEKDYRAGNIHPVHEGNATGTQKAFPRNCSMCHTAIGWTPAFLPSSFVGAPVTSAAAANHDRWFPIRSGPHRGAACDSCHAGGEAGGAVDCAGCHEHSPFRVLSSHRGRSVPSDARACLGCHPAGAKR